MNNWRIRVEFKGSRLKHDKITFTLRNAANLFIIYELDTWLQHLNADFTMKDCLFGAFKLAEMLIQINIFNLGMVLVLILIHFLHF